MALAVSLLINPSNSAQRYRLWDNGKIDNIGGAPAPTGNPTWYNAGMNPARALAITNWTTPSGYVLDFFGQIHTFGGATAPSSQAPNSSPYPYYVDCDMNPAGNGQGVILAQGGASYGISGATAPTQFSLGALAKRITKDWTSGKGYVLDGYGGRHPFGGAATTGSSPYWNGFDIARDYVVTDWPTGAGYVLAGWGSVHPVMGTPSGNGGPYWQGADSARVLIVVSTNPLTFALMTQNGNIYDWIVSSPPTLTAGGTAALPAATTTDTTRPTLAYDFFDIDANTMVSAEVVVYNPSTVALTDEVQVITLTGAPTSFKIQMESYITASIASGATAATVQAALRLLPTMGSCTVTGTSMAAGLTVTFLGARAGCKQNYLQGAGYVGGTNPNMGTVRTVQGTDVWDATFRNYSIYYEQMTSSTARATMAPFDLVNGTYKLFVRGTDSAGDRSGATVWTWTQSVTRPTTPVLTAVNLGGVAGIAVDVTVSSPPTGALVHIEYADDYDPADTTSGTWQTLRDADKAVAFTSGGGGWLMRDVGRGIRTPASPMREAGAVSTGIGVVDSEALFGVLRYYRAKVYTPTPYLASLPSTPVAATLTGNAWVLSDPQLPASQTLITVIPPFEFTLQSVASVFYPVGRSNAVVVRDGGLKGAAASLHVRVLGKAAYDALLALLETPSELFLRDIFGRGWYVEVVHDARFSLMRAAPDATDGGTFPLRHAHEVEIGVIQVDRPAVTDPDPFATFFA